MRQKDLAAALTLDGSSVVRLLDALEASGLIERREEGADRRAKIIVLTARGWSIIEQVEAASREVRNATLAGLSDDELGSATRVLELVCQNLAQSRTRRVSATNDLESSAPPPAVSPANRMIVTVCTVLATLMQSLDSTIANVALPYMQGTMSASQEEINWVLTSYIVAAAIMTAPTGFLAARFGRTRLFVTAVIGFTIASALCGLAESLGQIVVFRVLQGMFGAALVPLSQSVMYELYPPEQRAKAMGLWTMGVMMGPICGPILGGWLTDNYSWRWVFYINVPFGIADRDRPADVPEGKFVRAGRPSSTGSASAH